jgi:hypothetical protein
MRAARLVGCWRPGAAALRFAHGDLLCYAAPIDEDCENLPAWPLRHEGSALCSAPLSDLERAVIPDGDVWIVSGAEVVTLCKRDSEPIDPSTWLLVDHLSLHDTYDCSLALPVPVVLDFDSRPLREVLGNAVPSSSREQAEFLAAMERAQQKYAKRAPHARRAPWGRARRFIFVFTVMISIAAIISLGVEQGSEVLWALAFIGSIAWFIAGLLRREGALSARHLAAPRRLEVPRGALPLRSGLVHPQRWRTWLARIAMMSQLARLVGLAQARHLRRLLGFFNDGNLDEALRHAIPVDGTHGSLGQAFGTPGRRADLELTRVHRPTTAIGLDNELQNHLRTLYRQAFAKLDREKRFDEAVFVLAELLNAKREALDYLEKHQRFAQAAELALGWDMPPDVIVRLHCLAGDWRRAIVVARRDNAFATAVMQLEKGWPDVARRLREAWGITLIQQGDWLRAVDVVWPDKSLRAKATQWLLTAESVGGRLAARALVQRAVLLPDTLERYAKELQELQRNRLLWRDRLAMAEALASVGRSPMTERLAALIAPAVLADLARGHRRLDLRKLQRFVHFTGDVLLQADMPNLDWPCATAEPAAKRKDVLCLDAPEAGIHRVLDAVPLDDQCYLLALGESGACVVDATGRIWTRFAKPAQRVVLAQSRQVALLLARRESFWRVGRIDLAQKISLDVGVLAFDFWGTQFDGLNWTIAQGRHLRVIDIQDSLHQVVWQVADLPGVIRALTTSPDLEQILLEVPEKTLERWTYRLPGRNLLPIDDVSHIDGQLYLLNPSGGIVAITVGQSADQQLCLRWQVPGKSLEFPLGTALRENLRFYVAGEWLVVVARDESGYLVRWVLLATGAEHVRARWAGDAQPSVRPCGEEWLLYDARGRVLSFNAKSSDWHSFGIR